MGEPKRQNYFCDPAPIIFVTRFFPAKKIQSINKVWNLGKRQPLLPEDVVRNALSEVWPVVEKTADYAGVSPEVLLEGK